MGEITLPRWIITNRCMPHGYRREKKPKLPMQEARRNFGTFFLGPQKLGDSDISSFQGWEYRFWAADVTDPKSLISECRACRSIFRNDIVSRQLHLSSQGCAKRLTAAYKLLLRDKRCVICNQRTTKEKWGVPLCGSGCIQAWCEVESQPDALTAALQLLRNEDGPTTNK